MRGDEARVVNAFVRWLQSEGWEDVRTEVGWCDVVATRAGTQLYAEAKGRTAAVGLDVDTLYGQLLRRMQSASSSNSRFGVVVPSGAPEEAALRVLPRVRELLRIDVYVVDDDGSVRQFLADDAE